MIVNAMYGQLSNRIILNAHALATSFETKQDITLTSFNDIAKFYQCDNLSSNRIKIKKSFWWSFEERIIVILNRIFSRILHQNIGIDFSPKVITLWDYRDYENVEKHADKIRCFFQPKEELILETKEKWNEIKRSCDVIIGVYIRRGYYKTWCDGKYYYEDTVYEAVMKRLEKELNTKRVTFIIFSNEDIDINKFKVSSNVVCSKGNAIEDHWLMSMCDYLFGPPSTFTRWGAYMGKKPLAFIESSEEIISIKDFKYMSI